MNFTPFDKFLSATFNPGVPMRESIERFELPEAMDEKLRLVRSRLTSVGWVTAVVLGVAALLGAMLLSMLVDYLATLYDSSIRTVLTYSAMTAAAGVLALWAAIAFRRWRRLASVAEEVDRRVPQLEERWSIVTQEAERRANAPPSDTSPHPAVLQRVSEEAVRRGSGVTAGEVVSLNGLVRAFLVLNAVTIVLVLAAVLDWRQTNVLMRRFWAPNQNISATEISLDPGDIVIGRGEPLTLVASLSGTPVEAARLAIQSPDDELKQIKLLPRRSSDDAPQTASHRLRSVDESFTYRVRAGDGQTDWSEVTVADRPSIAAAMLTVTPPEYRNEQPETFKNLPRRVSIVEGSTIELAVKPRGEVASFTLKMGKEESIALEPDEQGWYRWSSTPEETLSLSPVLTEQHGLTNRRPPVTQVRVYPDRPPVVRVLTPDDEIAVTPDDTVEISFVAQDDNGVGAAELVVYQQTTDPILSATGLEQVELERIPIDLGASEGDKVVRGNVTLDLSKYELADGQSLSYEVRVTERRSPRSQPFDQQPVEQQPEVGTPPAAQPASQMASNEAGQTAPSLDEQPSAPNADTEMLASSPRNGQASPSQTNPPSPGATSKNTAVAIQAQREPSLAGDAAAEGDAAPQLAENSTTREEAAENSSATEGAPSQNPNESESALAANESTESGDPSESPGSPSTGENNPQALAANDSAQDATDSTGETPDGSSTIAAAESQASGSEAAPETPAGGAEDALADAPTPPTPAPGLPTPVPGVGLPKMAGNTPEADATTNATENAAPNASPRPGNASGEQMAQSDSPPGNGPSDAPSAPSDAGSSDKMASQNTNQPSNPNRAGQGGQRGAGGSPSGEKNRSATSSQRSLIAARSNKSEEEMSDDENSAEDAQPSGGGASRGGSTMAAANSERSNNSSAGERSAEAGDTENSVASAGNSSFTPMSDSQENGGGQRSSGGTSQNSRQNSGMASQTNPNRSGASGSPNPSQSNPDGSDNMTRRRFDMAQAAQTGTSNAMRVKIDQYAGSFEGQQRRKLEVAIAPDFAKFHDHIERAEKLTRATLDKLDSGEKWGARRHRDITSAEGEVRRAQKIVNSLNGRTRGTPYAFVGLQLTDISAANLTPAREHLWQAYQSEATERVESVRAGWQQLRRALDRLDRLTRQYESAREEFALADRAEQVKKMYRVFVEDSHIRLDRAQTEQSKHSRKMAQFELDDEYLERLQEVLKMRQELLAELARILDDDPRLLRRFMNNFQDQTDSLRRQVTLLRERQETLARDSGAWADNEQGERREAVLGVLRRLRLEETHDIAQAAGDLADRFEAWLPFDAASDAADPAGDTRQQMTEIASRGQELARAASADDAERAITEAEALYQSLREVETSLRRLGGNPDIEDIEGFAVRRILDARAMLTDVSSWLRRMRELQQGRFNSTAAIEQYQLASDTDQLASKLGAVEQQLAGLLQSADGSLPTEIAAKSRALLAALDERATPNQLGAAIALQQPDWQRVAKRQDAAVAALAEAERLFDELIAAAIEKLDELPVQDPIASLLEDPTLDEILAELERERDLAERLGIPLRPSNLRIIGDWMSPNSDGGIATGGNGGMLAAQIRSEMERMRQASDRMRQAALDRVKNRVAMVEREKRQKAQEKPQAKSTDWNQLVSELDEGLVQGRDKLPPQQYRSAIKQYYEIVNRQTNEASTKP